MSFLKEMTLARLMILICIPGSIVLGYRAWTQHELINTTRVALEQGGEFEDLTRQIQQNSRKYSQLVHERESDDLVALDNMDSYIRSHAQKNTALLGEVSVTPSEKSYGSFVDKSYRTQPSNNDKDRAYSRTAIGNFFYTLENDSARVRVTELEITNSARKIDAHEIPADTWTYKATITSRSRADS